MVEVVIGQVVLPFWLGIEGAGGVHSFCTALRLDSAGDFRVHPGQLRTIVNGNQREKEVRQRRLMVLSPCVEIQNDIMHGLSVNCLAPTALMGFHFASIWSHFTSTTKHVLRG